MELAGVYPLYGRTFHVSKFSVGFFYTAPVRRHLALDLGGLIGTYAPPKALDITYGDDPTSFMRFARFKIAD